MNAYFELVKPTELLFFFQIKKSPINLRTDGAARRDKLLEKEKRFKALCIQSCGSRRSSSRPVYGLCGIQSKEVLPHAGREDLPHICLLSF